MCENKETKPMDYRTWLQYYSNDFLTVADVQRMRVGETIEVLNFGSNNDEIIWETMQKNHAYRPEYFFQCCHDRFTKVDDTHWKIEFNWGETLVHPIHVFETHNDQWSLCESVDRYVTKQDVPVGWRHPVMLWSAATQADKSNVSWICNM
jgi:hypothetical protein